MMLYRFGLVAVIAVTAVTMLPRTATSAMLLTPERAAQVVSLRNVAINDGDVTGEIVNHSKQTMRAVQLQILYSWRWKNEWHPGKDDPGRAVYHNVDKVIPAGQSTRFDYKPSPPLPDRKDGFFDISVKIVGFEQIYP
jgi:hypothetical protein